MKTLLAPLLIASCHFQRELPRPSIDPGTRGMLLLALDGELLQSATAFDLVEGEGYPLISWSGEVDLVALEFGCTIERLGLVPGRQPLLIQPVPVTRLPEPRRIQVTPIDSPSWESVEMTPVIDAALRAIDLPEDNRCTAHRAIFEPTHLAVPMDGHTEPAFVLRYDAESSLIGSRDGKVYRVSRNGEIDRVPALEDRQYVGAWRGPRGELWMMSDRGTLASGTLSGLETVSATSAFGEGAQRVSLAGPTDVDAPFELFVSGRIEVGDTRAFVRFDGERWHPISRAPPHSDIFYPATLWLGPRHAVAIGVGPVPNAVVRYREGTITSETLPSSDGCSSMIQHPELGTLVGMDDGTIVHHTSNGWEGFQGGPNVIFVRTLFPLEDGFLFGSSMNFNFMSYRFGQYFPSTGFCEGQILTPDELATLSLQPLGDDALLAVTLGGFGYPLGLTMLELVERAGACSRD